jgi:hypothetical protein
VAHLFEKGGLSQSGKLSSSEGAKQA